MNIPEAGFFATSEGRRESSLCAELVLQQKPARKQSSKCYHLAYPQLKENSATGQLVGLVMKGQRQAHVVQSFRTQGKHSNAVSLLRATRR
jgi:hypothetical protein